MMQARCSSRAYGHDSSIVYFSSSMFNLFFHALVKYLLGVVLVGVLLFVPAGTLHFWQAWLFMAVLFLPMLVTGIVLMCINPALLRRRLDAKEKESEQKIVVAMGGLLFVAMFVTAGLNHRFHWWMLPDGLVMTASLVFLFGYAMYAEVMRENVWLSRTIEVQEDQQVVDKGLYGVVRHPMYAATLLLFLTAPLILASGWSLLIMLLYIPIVVKRIRNEEKVLEQELTGYEEYKRRVRWRLIPWIW